MGWDEGGSMGRSEEGGRGERSQKEDERRGESATWVLNHLMHEGFFGKVNMEHCLKACFWESFPQSIVEFHIVPLGNHSLIYFSSLHVNIILPIFKNIIL